MNEIFKLSHALEEALTKGDSVLALDLSFKLKDATTKLYLTLVEESDILN